MDQILYRSDVAISVEQFIDLLQRSTLAERRPVGDKIKIEKMLKHGNILITAWRNTLLVGVSRALADFQISFSLKVRHCCECS